MRAFLDRAGLRAALLLVVLICAVPAAQAKEVPSPWTWTDYGPALRDVSCSSPGTCTAVGQRGVTLRNIRGADKPLAWSKGFLAFPHELTGVTCARSFCLAVSNTPTSAATFASRIYRSTDHGARWANGVALEAAGAVKTRSAVALACTPADICFAVGPAGGVWRSGDQGRTWLALALPATPASYQRVACPATGTCLAVGGDSTPSSALIKGSTVTPLALPAKAGDGINGLACDTATRCTATDGLGHFMSLSIPDMAWGPAKTFPKSAVVSAMACPSENECIGLGDSGIALRTTKLSSATGDWHPRPLGTTNLGAINCVHTDCVAVGKAGTWFASFDAGSRWSRVNEVAAFDAIQCLAASRPTCVAGGKEDIGVSRSGGELWSLPLAGSLGLDIKSVNCTRPSECLFLGKTSSLFTTNLAHFTPRVPVTTSPAGADALTCITNDLCVGVSKGIVYTTVDGAVTGWAHNAFPDAPTSVACLPGRTDPAVCLATTTDFIFLGTMTMTGGVISWNWGATDADPSAALAAVACSSGGKCTAVGKEGVVLTSAGTDLTHWTQRTVPSGVPISDRPRLDSITCPSDGVCLAGGTHGPDAVIASTTNNWIDSAYDKIQGIEKAQATITSFGCETVDRCVAGGGTALVGVRKR